jgi:hypothetical protein
VWHTWLPATNVASTYKLSYPYIKFELVGALCPSKQAVVTPACQHVVEAFAGVLAQGMVRLQDLTPANKSRLVERVWDAAPAGQH